MFFLSNIDITSFSDNGFNKDQTNLIEFISIDESYSSHKDKFQDSVEPIKIHYTPRKLPSPMNNAS